MSGRAEPCIVQTAGGRLQNSVSDSGRFEIGPVTDECHNQSLTGARPIKTEQTQAQIERERSRYFVMLHLLVMAVEKLDGEATMPYHLAKELAKVHQEAKEVLNG